MVARVDGGELALWVIQEHNDGRWWVLLTNTKRVLMRSIHDFGGLPNARLWASTSFPGVPITMVVDQDPVPPRGQNPVA